jgi:chemotaxis protein methyltransferase CheR
LTASPMTDDLSDLAKLSDFLSERVGLHFPPERWSDLQDGIRAAAKELNFSDVDSCVRWLLASSPSKAQMETLASCFTVGETYFFRQSRQFEVLEDKIIPQIIRDRKDQRRLRIWSAGCCTGEEPYSLAILLDKFAADLAGWHVSILATDVNAKFLRTAEAGIYGDWSFRGVPEYVKERYFRRLPQGKREILPRLKEAVTFSFLNLAEDVYPSLLNGTNAMDVIFCRNVLMYFHPDRAADVVGRLKLCIAGQGSLFVSPGEVSQSAFAGFEAVSYPDVTAYRPALSRFPEFPEEAKTPEKGPFIAAASGSSISDRDTEPAAARSAQALISQARAFANQGRLAEALELCDGALALDKLDAPAHYLKGAILQEQGLMEAAEAAIRSALYLDADFVLAHFALGNLAHRAHRSDEAKRCYKNAGALLSLSDAARIVPETEGLTAGRLKEIIASTLNMLGGSA